MIREVRFKALERLLLQLGFVGGDLPGGQKVFLHRPTEAMIILPPYSADDRVNLPHLLGARKTLIGRGIVADEAAFDRLVQGAREPSPILSD